MDDSLERLRPLCLGLPDTTERISHGEPAWFVRDKKLFVTYANHHHDAASRSGARPPTARRKSWY